MSGNDDLFHYGKDILVDQGWNGTYEVQYADYEDSETEEQTLFTGKMRVAKSTSAHVDAPIPGAIYYSIFSKYRNISAGDVILRQNGSLAVTVLNNNDPSCATMGFLTPEIGALMDGQNVLFDNVRFCYLRSSTPQKSIDPDMVEVQQKMQVRVIALWKRPDILTMMKVRDNSTGLMFGITAIQPIMNVFVLTIEEGQAG